MKQLGNSTRVRYEININICTLHLSPFCILYAFIRQMYLKLSVVYSFNTMSVCCSALTSSKVFTHCVSEETQITTTNHTPHSPTPVPQSNNRTVLEQPS